jgi:heme exporter protein C
VTTQLAAGTTPSDGASRPDDAWPSGTGSRTTRVLGALAIVGVAAFVPLGLVVSPEDTVQGDLVRMFYIHVPMAIFAFLSCFVTGAGSVMYLWRKVAWWDTAAYGAAELGTVFTGLTLVTGMLWGRPAWGAYWEWDARLTSTAMLFLLLLGYLALRKAPGSAEAQAKRAAIVGILLVPQVIIVRQSVDWWRSLHQSATIELTGGTHMQGVMLFTFFLGFVVLGLVWLWLLIHRFRVAWLEHQIESLDLAEAITARRAEGAT